MVPGFRLPVGSRVTPGKIMAVEETSVSLRSSVLVPLEYFYFTVHGRGQPRLWLPVGSRKDGGTSVRTQLNGLKLPLLFCGCVQSCHIAFVMAYRFIFYSGTFGLNDLIFSLGPQDTVLGPSSRRTSHG
jgi:hypothetical protein